MTGLFEDYDLPEELRPAAPSAGAGGPAFTWAELLERWDLIEQSAGVVYGLDLTPALLRTRTPRWLRVRIAGLLAVDCPLSRALRPTPPRR